MEIGVNLEFARTEDITAARAMKLAAEAGYRYVEPYVYSDVALKINSHLALHTETDFHSFHARSTDVTEVNSLRKKLGLCFSAVDAHCSLLLPQIGLAYLKDAIDFAVQVECPIVVSDEGPLSSEWMNLEKSFDIMCFTLEQVLKYSRRRSILFATEPHNALTARPDYLLKLLDRFGPDELAVNFDTGNSFLAGNDPVEYLRHVAGRIVHVHVKDIPESQLDQRGKVTGTRVGVAAGEGRVDLKGIVGVLKDAGYDGVLSVECDTLEQARRSLHYLKGLGLF